MTSSNLIAGSIPAALLRIYADFNAQYDKILMESARHEFKAYKKNDAEEAYRNALAVRGYCIELIYHSSTAFNMEMTRFKESIMGYNDTLPLILKNMRAEKIPQELDEILKLHPELIDKLYRDKLSMHSFSETLVGIYSRIAENIKHLDYEKIGTETTSQYPDRVSKELFSIVQGRKLGNSENVEKIEIEDRVSSSIKNLYDIRDRKLEPFFGLIIGNIDHVCKTIIENHERRILPSNREKTAAIQEEIDTLKNEMKYLSYVFKTVADLVDMTYIQINNDINDLKNIRMINDALSNS